MKAVVVDASVALSWILPGEELAKALELRDFATNHPEFSLCVPPHFWYEVTNALWVAVRRGRLPTETALDAIDSLKEFSIDVLVSEPKECFALSVRNQLAVYDCAYLWIAIQWNLPLWTIDRSLAHVARNAGVVIEP